MSQNPMDSLDNSDNTNAPLLRREAKYSMLKNEALATDCLRELRNYRRNEPCDERYGLELLRRATLESDPEAWEWVQHCFSDATRGWIRRHPSRDAAMRLESEENYVALTFERFWQATSKTQKIEFKTLASAMQYIHASLHGAILDTLRAYARPKEVTLPEPGALGEPYGEDQADSNEVWDVLQSMLSDQRERRLAYLLYYCGLKPREIVHFCPKEWSNVHEIYRLRRNILDRLVHRADQLGWQLGMNRNCREVKNENSKANQEGHSYR